MLKYIESRVFIIKMNLSCCVLHRGLNVVMFLCCCRAETIFNGIIFLKRKCPLFFQGVTLTDLQEAEKTIGRSRPQKTREEEKEEKEKQDKEKQEEKKETETKEDDYRSKYRSFEEVPASPLSSLSWDGWL